MSDRNKFRMGLYVVAGAYLLYTAWQLFQGLNEVENRAVLLLFMVLFVAAGAALIGYSVWNLYKESRRQDGETREEADTPEQEETAQEALEETDEDGREEASPEDTEDTTAEDGEEP